MPCGMVVALSNADKYLLAFAKFLIKHWLTLVNTMVLVFILPIVLYPLFMAAGSPLMESIAGIILTIYHTTCHQLPDRSLFVLGYQMAVCSRCFAIYTAFLIGGILFYFIRKRLKPWDIKLYILLCVPMAIDGLAQLLGVPIPRGYDAGGLVWTVLSNNEIRVVTGAIFGLASALFALPYMQQVFEMEEEEQKEREKRRLVEVHDVPDTIK